MEEEEEINRDRQDKSICDFRFLIASRVLLLEAAIIGRCQPKIKNRKSKIFSPCPSCLNLLLIEPLPGPKQPFKRAAASHAGHSCLRPACDAGVSVC
jgi:hypothetical protein